jgi:hypothetical protein
MNKIEKADLANLRKDLDIILKQFADKNGLVFDKIGSISYDSSMFQTKIQFVAKTGNTTGKSIDEINYNKHCRMFNLKPEWLGKAVKVDGKSAKIVGLVPSKRKYPVIVEVNNTGRQYCMSTYDVRRQLIGSLSPDPMEIL